MSLDTNGASKCNSIASAHGFKAAETSLFCYARDGAPVMREIMAKCCGGAPITTNADYCDRLECQRDLSQQPKWKVCMTLLAPISGCQNVTTPASSTPTDTPATTGTPAPKKGGAGRSAGVSTVGLMITFLALGGLVMGQSIDATSKVGRRAIAGCTESISIGLPMDIVNAPIRLSDDIVCVNSESQVGDGCVLGTEVGAVFTIANGTAAYVAFRPFSVCQKQRQMCGDVEVAGEKCELKTTSNGAVTGEISLTYV